jgi:hypothetical protein
LSGNKKVNYAEGQRGNVSKNDNLDVFFDNDMLASDGNKSGFKPNLSRSALSMEQPAYIMQNNSKNRSDDDIFDINALSPQEINDNWFEVMPEPISVKNRHLINISKPIGVNTIGTSRKNASHDLRASPPCPKMVVSPWLQSSIEPDTNIKPLL